MRAPQERTVAVRIIAADPSVIGPETSSRSPRSSDPRRGLQRARAAIACTSSTTTRRAACCTSRRDRATATRWADPLPAGAVDESPAFHAQNVYALVMRTLARFEFALGRRVGWSFRAGTSSRSRRTRSRRQRVLLARRRGAAVRLLPDGKRRRRLHLPVARHRRARDDARAARRAARALHRPVVAGPGGVPRGVRRRGRAALGVLAAARWSSTLVDSARSAASRGTRDGCAVARPDARGTAATALLFGLAEQMGAASVAASAASALRALGRRSSRRQVLEDTPSSCEPHRRGEILVAAVMNAFLDGCGRAPRRRSARDRRTARPRPRRRGGRRHRRRAADDVRSARSTTCRRWTSRSATTSARC